MIKKLPPDLINTQNEILGQRINLIIEVAKFETSLCSGRLDKELVIIINQRIRTLWRLINKYDRVRGIKEESQKQLISFEKANEIMKSSDAEKIKPLSNTQTVQMADFIDWAIFELGLTDVGYSPKDKGQAVHEQPRGSYGI